jgi:hypothetical protein
MGVRLNIEKFWTRHLEAFGVRDPQSYFLEGGQPQLAPPGGGNTGTPPEAQSLLEAMSGSASPGGITNEQLAIGPASPSAEGGVSMSPVAPMQQALAQNGAGRSV